MNIYKAIGELIDIVLIGRNIGDEIVAEGALGFLNQTGFVNEPAFWGIEVSKHF